MQIATQISEHPVVTTQQTSKAYKAVQLAGMALVLVGVVSCNVAAPEVKPVNAYIILAGIFLYVGGRFAGWWNNG